ncbi:class I SAM-dependent methyltransferase [Paractinoplanes brasiliensis]|uniref:Ubiquinone/menaquinone biosynthesis C-methylase UbiE n=1 Tax=Paractinoplanes brasiliensis TaxID=52695 RepID=A0A4R6K2T2_9ACTN|nr:methyltransferase domain-containing protein [Actinoplanes brasiliensis]TDO42652.1 ubiquinone/menaquinone biosynthesis C-methylase UbiE [Actinoplanes brasiliensis]GID31244.1 methyltransferase [Actinoplanes brasiliensis]
MSVAEVFDKVAGRYDNVGVDFFTPLATALVSAAAPQPGESVLDAGCGRGAALLAAAGSVGPEGHVTGIDFAPGMVERTAAATAGLTQVTVQSGDAQKPDFPPASFDLITAALVLFFLPDPPAALTEYHRLLRPGGRLAFSSFAAHDPLYPETLRLLGTYAPAPPERPKLHPMFGSPAGLIEAVTAAGFATAETTEVSVDSTYPDAATFVRWIGSHMGAVTVDAVPPSRLPEATAAVEASLEWPLTLTTRITLTIAHVTAS